jgi:hypothetical protein
MIKAIVIILAAVSTLVFGVIVIGTGQWIFGTTLADIWWPARAIYFACLQHGYHPVFPYAIAMSAMTLSQCLLLSKL